MSGPESLVDRGDPAVLYAITLLFIRAVVGVLGILLPLVLIVGEAWFMQGDVAIRGSLSAYYHTAMRDVFVAALCVIGFMLMMYMAGKPETRDFRWSLGAGASLLGVVFFPTKRPGLGNSNPLCGVDPMPQGCSAVQQALGETLTAGIHFLFAVAFLLCLARICFLFAHREAEFLGEHGLARTLRVLGWIIMIAVVYAALGAVFKHRIFGLTPLYVAEVAAVLAFGLAWILKARALREAFAWMP